MSLLLDVHHRFVRIPRVDRVADAVSELAEIATTVLDVGAGDGLVGAAIGRRLGAHVQGVDVRAQKRAAIDVRDYDGVHLPFEDAAFDVVVLADVLHHAKDPLSLLREGLRVAKHAAVVKDHFAFGRVSAAWLGILDRVGNAQQEIPVLDAYLTPRAWLDLVDAAGGIVTKQIWPLEVHSRLLHVITRSELQFGARVEKRGEA